MSKEDKKIWAVLDVSEEAKIEAKRLAKLNKIKIGKFLESLIFNKQEPDSGVSKDILGVLHVIGSRIKIVEDEINSLSVQMDQVSRFINSMPNIYIGEKKPKTFWGIFSRK